LQNKLFEQLKIYFIGKSFIELERVSKNMYRSKKKLWRIDWIMTSLVLSRKNRESGVAYLNDYQPTYF